MKNYLPILKKAPLFNGIPCADVEKLCGCLEARAFTVARDSYVFRASDSVRSVYLLLSGMVHITSEDFWGNQTIIESMTEHTLFGEAYAVVGAEQHLVSVVAAEDSLILEIDPEKLFETCQNECECHDRLIKNTMRILSEKIIRLTEKMGHISQRTMREKILSYLSDCSRRAHSNSFYVLYSRQQLADYLCADRSALSHELSKLQKDGMIRYRKNHFELLAPYNR